MTSQKYFCFKCRDNGFPNEEVVFSGKDEQGKTIYKNPDMTPHQHKQQQVRKNLSPLSETQQQPKTEYDKSVDNGISAFSMMTSLIRLVEQNQKLLVTMDDKLDRLLNLVYAQQQQSQEKK